VRIGVFVAMAGRQSGGPETYERCLLRALLDLDRENEYHVFCLTRGARDSFRIERDNLRFHVLFPRQRWISTLTSLPLSMIANKVDLLHATVVPPPFSPRDYVFTMHCFSNFVHPELYPPVIRLPLNHSIVTGLRKSRLILCVSENVRDLVVERFGIPREKLLVTYNGVGEEFRPLPADEARTVVAERYGVRGPYVLFVGQLKARKNVIRIIEAFGQVRHELHRPELKLVLAGRRIWTSEGIDEAIDRHKLRAQVVELGHVEHEDLPVVYSGAEVLLFPSLWEGFGIPVIEAMACGVPVVTSNLSCLPEVAGGGAVLVDPYSVEDIAAGTFRVLSDAGLREELRRKGFERARQLTWKRAAEQTVAAYRTALGR
jgi:glycosyltransferase involved in cell wall biosynthesis